MGYFQAKSDHEFAQQFKADVQELWKFEKQASERVPAQYYELPTARKRSIQRAAAENPNYVETRDNVARGMLRAIRLARRHGVPCDIQSVPAPAVGGAIIPVNVFRAILHDNSHGGVEYQMIADLLTQLEGETDQFREAERRRLLNPLNWVKELFLFLVRIPFMLVEASGFDVGKVEDHFLAKLFKLVELIAILYVMYKLGFDRESVRAFLLKMLTQAGAA